MINMQKYIGAIGVLLALAACSTDEIMTYDTSKRSLYVPTTDGQDSIEVSFKHYIDINDYEVKMPIRMNGTFLEEDAVYRLEIDEELTTAKPEDYTVSLEQVFHAGVVEDSMSVTLHRTAHLSSEKVRVAFRLVPNETFGVAEYMGNAGMGSVPRVSSIIKVRFSDMLSQLEWWDSRITNRYLGQYSDKKYEYLIISCGMSDLSGCSTTELRKIMEKFKDDIRINGWTEEDGTPIEIVM